MGVAHLKGRLPERGFTLLEIVVVIMLIGTLLVVGSTRLINYVEEAERVAVLTLEGRLRSALLLETAKRVLDDDDGGVVALADSNPMRLMLEAPYNYAGELEPGNVLDRPCGWRIETPSLQEVCAVETGGVDADPHLLRSRAGIRSGQKTEHVRGPRTGDHDGVHVRHVRMPYPANPGARVFSRCADLHEARPGFVIPSPSSGEGAVGSRAGILAAAACRSLHFPGGIQKKPPRRGRMWHNAASRGRYSSPITVDFRCFGADVPAARQGQR